MPQGRYFWLDLLVDSAESERRARELLASWGHDERAVRVLFDFSPLGGKSLRRRYHADGEHVVFAFHCVKHPGAPLEDGADAIDPVEVHVMVHGDYLVTVHQEAVNIQPPPEEAPPVERGEKYLVSFALYQMTITLFETLTNLSDAVEDLETSFVDDRFDPATDRKEIPPLRPGLTLIRRLAGRQQGLFAHVAEEIEQVRGLEGSGRYFDRIDTQFARLVSGIDAEGASISASTIQSFACTTVRPLPRSTVPVILCCPARSRI